MTGILLATQPSEKQAERRKDKTERKPNTTEDTLTDNITRVFKPCEQNVRQPVATETLEVSVVGSQRVVAAQYGRGTEATLSARVRGPQVRHHETRKQREHRFAHLPAKLCPPRSLHWTLAPPPFLGTKRRATASASIALDRGDPRLGWS